MEGSSPDTGCRIPMQMLGYPRDLLQNFISGTPASHRKLEGAIEEDGGGEGVELSLGLSLNGRFGVDPTATKLVRSSSIPEFLKPFTENGNAAPMACSPIMRTCSLPMESEDECRKRKAIQSLRRMEAKRKRTEKQRNSRAMNCPNGRVYLDGLPDEERKIVAEPATKHLKDWFLRGASDVSVTKEATFGISNGDRDGKGAGRKGENDNNDLAHSQGSGASGISEFDSISVQGSNKCTEVRSHSTVQTVPETDPKSPSVTTAPPGYSSDSSAPKARSARDELSASSNGVNGMVRNLLLNMPCVSTRGDGPDGKKLEGFLYRYNKGEEVKIVCVCHGRFLTPAEFVKHAGGGDVSQPLKHIVVNASPVFQ